MRTATEVQREPGQPQALGRVVLSMMRDETQLFKQFSDNDSFRAWLAEAVFQQTYGKSA